MFKNWIDKKDTVKMSGYFPEPNFLGANVKMELDLSNYATRADATGLYASTFPKNTYLANL